MFAASVSCVSTLVLMCSLSFLICSIWLFSLCPQFLHSFFLFFFLFQAFCYIDFVASLCTICYTIGYVGPWQKVCVLMISYDTEITFFFSFKLFLYSYKILQNVVSCISMYSYQLIYCNMSFLHCSSWSRSLPKNSGHLKHTTLVGYMRSFWNKTPDIIVIFNVLLLSFPQSMLQIACFNVYIWLWLRIFAPSVIFLVLQKFNNDQLWNLNAPGTCNQQTSIHFDFKTLLWNMLYP